MPSAVLAENVWASLSHAAFPADPCFWSSYNQQQRSANACLWVGPFPDDQNEAPAIPSEPNAEQTWSLIFARSAGNARPLTLDDADAPNTAKRQAPAEQRSPKHIFGVVPAYNVSYLKHFKPLTPRQKFDLWLRGTYDIGGLGLNAAEAASLEYSSHDGFCGYGKGGGNYAKCFGSLELEATSSSFFGDFLFPVLMHQDPRYFRLGEGSFAARTFYAVSRVFVTHSDSGHKVFFASALSGSVAAAALYNLYGPRQDRGFNQSLNHFGLDLADAAAFNVAAEFWPEIRHKLKRVF